MQCPKCGFAQNEGAQECPRCGIVFARYEEYQKEQEGGNAPVVEEGRATGLLPVVKELLFPFDYQADPLFLTGRALLYLILLVWGVRFILAGVEGNFAGQSILHLVNLPFHEAGHIIFSPFGRFLSTLGGSLMQLLIPAVCATAFLIWYRNPFGAGVCLGWLGQSMMDLAPYIADAKVQRLILLGGVTGRDAPGFHDWNVILKSLGLLESARGLAFAAHGLGALCMLAFFAWGGALLWMEWKEVRE